MQTRGYFISLISEKIGWLKQNFNWKLIFKPFGYDID